MASERQRNWTFILYPESCHPCWRTVLDDLHLPWAESPLHEHDLNADGEPKKPHWHIILCFDGVKTYEQIKEITDSVMGTRPEIVRNVRSMIRYFAHLDNPEKWQYPTQEIIGHGGLDVPEMLQLLSSRKAQILQEIFSWIADNHITEFSDLIDYCMYSGNTDWFRVATEFSTLPIKTYLASVRNKKNKQDR